MAIEFNFFGDTVELSPFSFFDLMDAFPAAKPAGDVVAFEAPQVARTAPVATNDGAFPAAA